MKIFHTLINIIKYLIIFVFHFAIFKYLLLYNISLIDLNLQFFLISFILFPIKSKKLILPNN